MSLNAAAPSRGMELERRRSWCRTWEGAGRQGTEGENDGGGAPRTETAGPSPSTHPCTYGDLKTQAQTQHWFTSGVDPGCLERGGGVRRGYGFFLGARTPPPLRLSAIFFLYSNPQMLIFPCPLNFIVVCSLPN